MRDSLSDFASLINQDEVSVEEKINTCLFKAKALLDIGMIISLSEIIAPYSVHWEIGNAFSAMLKRKKIEISNVMKAMRLYKSISITFIDVELEESLLIVEN